MITDQWINGSMDISGNYKYVFLMFQNFRSDQTKRKRYKKAGKTFLEYGPWLIVYRCISDFYVDYKFTKKSDE